ncbi:MAG TPA: O-antigen ligase family protein [Pyrinomonadaceae bacterium]|nr:O-antigen ligase family protein [Pyrinomonadaceae bacterium]
MAKLDISPIADQDGLLPGSGSVSRYEKTILGVLLAIPVFATLAYGATEVWSLIPLSFLTLILVVLWAADGSRAGRFGLNSSALQIPIVALIVIGLIQLLPFGSTSISDSMLSVPASSALSLDPYATRLFVARLILFLVFFALALRFINTAGRCRVFAVSIVIFGALMAFAGILQRLASPDAIYGMRPTPQAIPFGPFVNQHHFAAFMAMCLGLALAMLIGSGFKRDRKGLLVIAVFLMAIALLMTGSRGGMIATAAVVTTVAAGMIRFGVKSHTIRSGAAFKFAAAAILTGFLAIGAVAFLAGADPLIRGIGLDSGQADPTSGRLHFWSVGWKVFLDHPMIGAGHDAFGVAFTRHDTWNGYFRVEQAHNDYLQILADGGLLSFLCVVFFLVLLIRKSLNVIRLSECSVRGNIAIGALAGCIGMAVHSFFDFPLRTSSNGYFFLLLAVLTTAFVKQEAKAVRSSRRTAT